MVEISQLEHFANAVETTTPEPTKVGGQRIYERPLSEVRPRTDDTLAVDLQT